MQSNIRKAFERALLTMPNGIGANNTAFENTTYIPSGNEPYQRVRLIPLPVENPTFGDAYHREVGFYQITLSYPKGFGVGEITAMADRIKTYFHRGRTLTLGTDEIILDRTPEVSPVYINDTRAEMNIRCRYFCSQFTA